MELLTNLIKKASSKIYDLKIILMQTYFSFDFDYQRIVSEVREDIRCLQFLSEDIAYKNLNIEPVGGPTTEIISRFVEGRLKQGARQYNPQTKNEDPLQQETQIKFNNTEQK